MSASLEDNIRGIVASVGADRAIIVCDETTDNLARDFLPEMPRVVIERGEDNKTLRQAEKIWEFLESQGATRHSFIINFGGGMVSDVGGFAASTFKRGVKYMNVATTLLAAVDASIGGKTGVNFAGLKNEIGVFALPLASLAATEFFGSLPHEEWLSGYGEMLKTGLLCGNPLYDELTEGIDRLMRDHALLARLVRMCADYKESVVEADLREGGLRKTLNLGHTAGHAIEMLSLEKGRPLPHGVAVAHGILVSLILSRLVLDVSSDLMYDYNSLLKENFPPSGIVCDDIGRLIELMGRDKKNREMGVPAFVLLAGIGSPVIDVTPDSKDLEAALEIAVDMGC